ncbi:SAM-dependent methyltransferase-like protein [Apiospora kogelbergensis]|uniref:SAM-dependent methyltransferase-like protein n=1 Tax=Apiospora kogelbergensis TaxID=1337665 RepID=UPI00312CFE3F
MTSFSPQELATFLVYDFDHEHNIAAIQHRQQVTKAWGIPPGSSILEIGCGQGDFTVVLADAVGAAGRVVAVDPAPPDWGTPDYKTAHAHVLASPIGPRVTFVQEDPVSYLSGDGIGQPFDFIIFGYCIWFFAHPELLGKMLEKAHRHAKAVLIVEYSLSASIPAQVPHLLTALTDNALESFRGEESDRNIRCALSPAQIAASAAQAGWALLKEETITPGEKQVEGRREVRMVVQPRLFRRDLDDVVSRVDTKVGTMLHAMVKAVEASTKLLEGGVDAVRNMDVWVARFEKPSK